MFTQQELSGLIPLPASDANKYSRGKCVVIAGSPPYPGAALLTSWASQCMGSGYTEVFTAKVNEMVLQIRRPSLVVRSFEKCSPAHLIPLEHHGAVVVGPGFDVNDAAAHDLCVKAVKDVKHPLLLDGGALTIMATDEGRELIASRAELGRITVLTPHHGEAARLIAVSDFTPDNLEDAATQFAQAYQAIVVLKGPITVVSDGKRTEVFDGGTPALAKAGTGDVLAGMIGGLLAQGVEPFGASYLGVSLHAEAAKIAACELTEVSVCAEDVVEALPYAIGSYLCPVE